MSYYGGHPSKEIKHMYSAPSVPVTFGQCFQTNDFVDPPRRRCNPVRVTRVVLWAGLLALLGAAVWYVDKSNTQRQDMLAQLQAQLENITVQLSNLERQQTIEHTAQWRQVEGILRGLKTGRNNAALERTVNRLVDTLVRTNNLTLPPQKMSEVMSDRWTDTMDAENYDRLEELRVLFAHELRQRQNPASCDELLFCDLTYEACGFACQMHRISWCFLHGLMENRTVVLKPPHLYQYGEEDVECDGRWDCFFETFSRCQDALQMQVARGPTMNFRENPYQQAHIQWLPPSLADLPKLTANPQAWLVGQIVAYVFKPNARVRRFIDEKSKTLGLTTTPDVGIHVRRSDKIKGAVNTRIEADYHTFSEYMQHVDRWVKPERYHRQAYDEKYNVTVFVASDDPTVYDEFRHWPQYTFITNKAGAEQASDVLDDRWSKGSLDNAIFDISLLASAPYFVGTFSSQISRMVFELYLGQGKFDAPGHVQSLDDRWYGAA